MSLLAASLVLLAAQAAPAPPKITATLPEPSAEAMDLARTISRNSLIAAIFPAQSKAEIESILRTNPDLTAEEQATLRRISAREADAMLARFVEADARAHARRLSVEELRAIAAFEVTPAAASRRAAMPFIVADAMATLGTFDFGRGVRRAFCAETGKLCD